MIPERDGHDYSEGQAHTYKDQVIRDIAAEDCVHGLIELIRIAQISVKQLPEKGPVLSNEGAVESVLGDIGVNAERRCPRPEDRSSKLRAARDEMLEDKGDDGHPEDDHQGLPESADDV